MLRRSAAARWMHGPTRGALSSLSSQSMAPGSAMRPHVHSTEPESGRGGSAAPHSVSVGPEPAGPVTPTRAGPRGGRTLLTPGP